MLKDADAFLKVTATNLSLHVPQISLSLTFMCRQNLGLLVENTDRKLYISFFFWKPLNAMHRFMKTAPFFNVNCFARIRSGKRT